MNNRKALIIVVEYEHKRLTKWAEACNGVEEKNIRYPEYGKVVASYTFFSEKDRTAFLDGLNENFGEDAKQDL